MGCPVVSGGTLMSNPQRIRRGKVLGLEVRTVFDWIAGARGLHCFRFPPWLTAAGHIHPNIKTHAAAAEPHR